MEGKRNRVIKIPDSRQCLQDSRYREIDKSGQYFLLTCQFRRTEAAMFEGFQEAVYEEFAESV